VLTRQCLVLEGASLCGTQPSKAYNSVASRVLQGARRAMHSWGGFGRIYREGGFGE
jgi:hypothetical protein